MEKTKKHQKADATRQLIASEATRRQMLNELVTKTSWDESDILRVVLLCNKPSLVEGCEEEYKKLLTKIAAHSDDNLISKAEKVAKRLNFKIRKSTLQCHIAD
jgi:hypothetical protein